MNQRRTFDPFESVHLCAKIGWPTTDRVGRRNNLGVNRTLVQPLNQFDLCVVVEMLLDLVGEGEYTCAEVRDRTSEHLVEVEAKIRDLKRIQRSLKAMVATCSDGSMPDCPIIDFLSARPQTRPISK